MYTIPCCDRVNINVVVVVQRCTDSLQVLPGLSSEIFPTSSDCTYDIGNMKVEEDIDVQEEEEEVNVKTEKVIVSEEEECIDVKEEDIDTEEEEYVDVKEQVS